MNLLFKHIVLLTSAIFATNMYAQEKNLLHEPLATTDSETNSATNSYAPSNSVNNESNDHTRTLNSIDSNTPLHPIQLISSDITDTTDNQAQKTILNSPKNYSVHIFANDVKAIKWDAIGTFAGITALGLKSWKWGNTGFHFHNEKWFQKDRSSIGMDKLGHAFTSYTMTNLFAEHLQRKGRTPAQSAISAALLTQALMLYVETFDGFSTDHGFSYEDVIMNLAGTSLAYARQRYPRVKSFVDYRMEYMPSGYKGDGIKGFRPISDYAGQKYHLAFKLSGFASLRETPLKYLELQAGYYARGFTPQEQALGLSRTRTGFVGVGLNLSEVFFGQQKPNDSIYVNAGRTFFEHIQLPTYTTLQKNNF